MSLLSLPDVLLEGVLGKVLYGEPLVLRNGELLPLEALCHQGYWELVGPGHFRLTARRGSFFAGDHAQLPEDGIDGGGTHALVRAMLVSKAMRSLATADDLWDVPLRLLSSSVASGDLEFVRSHHAEALNSHALDCWVDPRLRADWGTKSTYAQFASLRCHVARCRKRLFEALELALAPVQKWLESSIAMNVDSEQLIQQRLNTTPERATEVVREALRFHFIVHKYACEGSLAIDVVELLHLGWSAVEMETTNCDSLFEIGMDKLGYERSNTPGHAYVYVAPDLDEEEDVSEEDDEEDEEEDEEEGDEEDDEDDDMEDDDMEDAEEEE